MRQYENHLEEANVRVAVVTFEAEPVAMAYVRQTGLSWPLLVDSERSLYHAYGMERGRWWDLAGPSACWAYLKLFARGRRLRVPGSDVKQLGGDVLIDPEGVVRFHHIGSGPADRPAIQDLLTFLGDAFSSTL